MHSAHSPETHSPKDNFKTEGFLAAVGPEPVITKQLQGENNHGKNKSNETDFPWLFGQETTTNETNPNQQKSQKDAIKPDNQQQIKQTREESRRRKRAMDAQK